MTTSGLAMDYADSVGERLLGGLLDAAHTVAPDDLASLISEHASSAGATDVAVYLQDYDQRCLVPIISAGMPARDPEQVEGSMAGRAFTSGTLVEWPCERAGVRLWYPMVDGTDRVGVLAMTFLSADDYQRRLGSRLAGLVAELIVTKGNSTDLFFRTRRQQKMSLAAEMQWHLLPPLTVTTPDVAIAGVLQPAYEVGGDAFDYSLNGRAAQFAIFDAIGHCTRAAVMASLVVGAYRHARRQGADLPDTYELIDGAVTEQFGEEDFATAQMADLDLDTGWLRWVNAGHPPPLLVRHRKLVRALSCETTLPLGLGGASPQVAIEQLEPGDRVLFYTDGVVEERLPCGEPFGERRLVEHLVREQAAGASVSETARRLGQALAAQWHGTASDDATLVLVEWSGEDHTSMAPE